MPMRRRKRKISVTPQLGNRLKAKVNPFLPTDLIDLVVRTSSNQEFPFTVVGISLKDKDNSFYILINNFYIFDPLLVIIRLNYLKDNSVIYIFREIDLKRCVCS